MHTRLDILILLTSCFVIGLLFSLTWSPNRKDVYVLFVQSSGNTKLIDLGQDGTHLIHNQTGLSEIQVYKHTARFKNSNCLNKICVQHGWLTMLRPMAVCIPNEISIQLGNNTSPTNIDAFAY